MSKIISSVKIVNSLFLDITELKKNRKFYLEKKDNLSYLDRKASEDEMVKKLSK